MCVPCVCLFFRLSVCFCVRACVRASVRACVRACVCMPWLHARNALAAIAVDVPKRCHAANRVVYAFGDRIEESHFTEVGWFGLVWLAGWLVS